MGLFKKKPFRERKDTYRVKFIWAYRVKYSTLVEREEIEMKFVSEEGDEISLLLSPNLTHLVVQQLSEAYETINPPLKRQSQLSSGEWQSLP